MTTTIRRGALAAVVGGTLWALLPAVFALADIQSTPRGTLEFVAVATASWLVAVAPLALLLVALHGTRGAFEPSRLGTSGIVCSGLGLAAMLAGNGTELTTLTAAGREDDLGHTAFLIGFLVLLVGQLLRGIALLRKQREPLIRAAGVVLVLALPVSVGALVLLSAVSAQTDAGFWAAITVPTGIGWLLLGRALLPRTAERPAIA